MSREKSTPRRWYVVQRESDSLFLRRTQDAEIDRWVATPDEASIVTQLSHARAMIIRRVTQGPMKIRTLNYLPDGTRLARKQAPEMPPQRPLEASSVSPVSQRATKHQNASQQILGAPAAPPKPHRDDGMVTLGSLLLDNELLGHEGDLPS